MNERILMLDMDLTINDIYPPLVEALNEEYKLDLEPNNWKKYWWDHSLITAQITRKMVEDIFSSDEFFLHLPVMRGAKTAIPRLMKKFDVYVLTSPWMSSERPYADKYDWLKRHFPGLENKMIPTSHKWLVYGDILVDDHMPNCYSWKAFWDSKGLETKTASLKYPWTDPNKVDIIGKNWKELADKIEMALL